MKQLFQGSALALLVLGAGGCGLIKSAVQANESNRLEELEAAGDYESLAETCKKPRHGAACKAKARVGAKRLEQSSCETLVDDTRSYYGLAPRTKDGDLKLVEKYQRCGIGQELFAQSFGIRWRAHAWTELDKGGTAVFGDLLAYLETADVAFTGQAGTRTAKTVAEWLVSIGDASRCDAIDKRMNKVAPESQGEFLWLYHEVGCAEHALPMALERLGANQANQRIQACDVLGKFGGADAIDKLEILARTDTYKGEREVRTASGFVGVEVFFPVRERCLDAMGKIQLRN